MAEIEATIKEQTEQLVTQHKAMFETRTKIRKAYKDKRRFGREEKLARAVHVPAMLCEHLVASSKKAWQRIPVLDLEDAEDIKFACCHRGSECGSDARYVFESLDGKAKATLCDKCFDDDFAKDGAGAVAVGRRIGNGTRIALDPADFEPELAAEMQGEKLKEWEQ
jgi:hypothetical protein